MKKGEQAEIIKMMEQVINNQEIMIKDLRYIKNKV